MYIRWKVKPRAAHWRAKEPVNLYVAYLAESRRINGKPRQTTIYLASIKDIFFNETAHQHYFWQRINAKLESMQLDEKQLSSIKNALLQRVPFPSQSEYEEVLKLRHAAFGH